MSLRNLLTQVGLLDKMWVWRIANVFLNQKYISALIREASVKAREQGLSAASLKEYKKAARKYSVSFEEFYLQFDFPRQSDLQREQFMSQVRLRLLYNTLLKPKDEEVFWDKAQFLCSFHNFIKREWIDVAKIDYERFLEFITKYDCIAKPSKSSCGTGVFKIVRNSSDMEKSLFLKLSQDNYILEQCIRNEASIAAFHPSSLNTVRVVTVRGKSGKIWILGSFIRFGTGGNIVDNGGKNGILSQIDLTTGEIFTDAVDKDGRSFATHPDSGITFKGFRILKFKEMLEVCVKAARTAPPSVPIIGWDVVIRDDGIIDIIEGNQRPDAYGLQTPVKIGYKDKLYKFLNS